MSTVVVVVGTVVVVVTGRLAVAGERLVRVFGPLLLITRAPIAVPHAATAATATPANTTFFPSTDFTNGCTSSLRAYFPLYNTVSY
jgi:hypothetical protein